MARTIGSRGQRDVRGDVDATATTGESDSQILGLARGGGLNLIGAVCNQLAGLGITLLIARELGRAQLGRYAQAYAVMAILGLLSLSGLRTGMLRFVAVHRAERDPGSVRGVVRLGIALTTGSSLLLGIGLFFAAPWLVEVVFHDARLVLPLQIVALTLPAATLMDSALAATQGYRTMKPYAVIGLMFELARAPGCDRPAAQPRHRAAWDDDRAAGQQRGGCAARRGRPVPAAGAPTTPTRYHLRDLFGFSMVEPGWRHGHHRTDLGRHHHAGHLPLERRGRRLQRRHPAGHPGHLRDAGDQLLAEPPHRRPLPPWADRRPRPRLRRGHELDPAAVPARLRRAVVVFPRDLLAIFGKGFQVGAAVTIILAAGKLIDAGTGPCSA